VRRVHLGNWRRYFEDLARRYDALYDRV